MDTKVQIEFGEVSCFVLGKSPTRQVCSKQDDIHIEQKRFVAIREHQRVLYIEFYKDESKYKKQKPLFKDALYPKHFCGLTRGDIRGSSPKKKKTTVYLALVFDTFTVLLLHAGDDAEQVRRVSDEWELDCGFLLGHIKTKRVIVDIAPPGDENLSVGGTALLSITNHRLSISSHGNHHRCCHSWIIRDVCLLDDIVRRRHTLIVSVFGSGVFKFSRSSSSDVENFFNDIKGLLKKSMLERKAEMEPYYITLPKKQHTSTETPPRPSCMMWNQGRQHQKVPRQPLPDLVQPSSKDGNDSHGDFYLPSEDPEQPNTCEVTYGEYLTTCSVVKSNGMEDIAMIYENYVAYEEQPQSGEYFLDLNEIAMECSNSISEIYLTTDTRRASQPHIALDIHPNKLLKRQLSSPNVTVKPKFNGTSRAAISLPSDDTQKLEHGAGTMGSHGSRTLDRAPRPSSDAENLIFRTIERVLQGIPPHKDTLRLSHKKRVMLCLRLYLPCPESAGSMEGSWVLLAEIIGLRMEAIELITRIVSNHRLPIPAAEVVLRHWQYMFNKYGRTPPEGKCPYKCSLENLLFILSEKMARSDLVTIILREQSR